MNLRDLKYLVELKKEQNFSKAAQKSFVSQPALSMQIKKLEDELGVKIFERAQKKFLITQIGFKIIEKAEIILLEVEEIKNLAKNSKDIFGGELKVAAFPGIASYFFPQFVKQVSKEIPRLKVFLVEEKTEKIIEKLESGAIDCAFLAMPVLNNLFEAKKIFEEPFLLAVSKKHELAKRKKIQTKELKNRSLMLLEDGHCMRNQTLEFCSFVEAFEEADFKATSLETLRQMVISGVGITLMPKIAVQKSDKISYIEIINPPKRTIGLYFRKGSAKKEIFEELVKILK